MKRYITEMENTVFEWIKARDLHIKKVAELCGTFQPTIHSLAVGYTSPVYLKGKHMGEVKPIVAQLSKVLNVPVDVLFPRYICPLSAEVNPEETFSITTGWFSQATSKDVAEIVESNESLTMVISFLTERLGERDAWITIACLMFDYTLQSVADEYGLSKERIRQIVAVAVNLIRRNRRVIWSTQ